MKPINKSLAQIIDELRGHLWAWKKVHRLDDTQVVTLASLALKPFVDASYVTLSREDQEGRPDRVPRIPKT